MRVSRRRSEVLKIVSWMIGSRVRAGAWLGWGEAGAEQEYEQLKLGSRAPGLGFRRISSRLVA